MTDQWNSLLTETDPPPARVENAAGASPFFLTCDHAGNRIPEKLGDLGLPDFELQRHIAWDVGAEPVASMLSAQLDAPLVLQTYSRLVIDCNRTPDRPDAMPTLSELTEIPGNRDLHPAHKASRTREIFEPYHAEIAGALDQRQAAGQASLLVAVHSFTPVFKGVERPWHVGLLYNRDSRLAAILKELIGRDGALCLGDNEPYAISDETDYGIPVHGEARGIPHIEFEVRHDLIETPDGQSEWAERLAVWLTESLTLFEAAHGPAAAGRDPDRSP